MPLSDLETVCIREPTSSTRCGIGISRSRRDLPPADYLFKIQSFPLAVEKEVKKYESNVFRAGGYSWKLVLYPNGKSKRNGKGHVSLYLTIADTEKLSRGWEVNVNFKLFVFDHNYNNYLTIQDADGVVRKFNEMKSEWGFEQLISLEELCDSCNGYLDEEDTCVFGAEVFVIRHSGNWESFDVAGENPPTTSGSSTDSKPPTSSSSTDGKPPTIGSSTDLMNPAYGLFTWTLDSYVLQKQSQQITAFHACKIYWDLRVSEGYDKSGKYLSILLNPYDRNRLPNITFKGSVKYKFLDQLHNKYHREETVNFNFSRSSLIAEPYRSPFYCPNMISLSELIRPEKGYVKDDVVIFVVEIFMDSAK